MARLPATVKSLTSEMYRNAAQTRSSNPFRDSTDDSEAKLEGPLYGVTLFEQDWGRKETPADGTNLEEGGKANIGTWFAQTYLQ